MSAAEKTSYPPTVELDPDFLHTKINWKWVRDPNVGLKIMNLLEGNAGHILI